MQDLMTQLSQHVGDPRVVKALIAIGVLFGGWIGARLAAWLVKRALESTTIDNRLTEYVLGKDKGQAFDIEGWLSKLVYYILLLFVLVLFFNTLELTVVSGPIVGLLDEFVGFIPNLIAAAGLIGIAWVVAFVVRKTVSAAAGRWSLDEKVGVAVDEDRPSLGHTLGDAMYWLVFLLFLPSVLGVLQIEGLLGPVQNMMAEFLAFLPNLFAAAAILVVGWLLARVLQRIVTNLLAAVGADKLGDKLGLGTALGTRKLSGLLGLVLYVFLLFNVLLSSLTALELESITRPASNMLSQVLEAIPLLFGAGLLLTLAFYVGRLVSSLVANVLAGAGFDSVLQKLGFTDSEKATKDRRPSELVGTLLLSAIMLFASVEAAGMLGFENLSVLLARLLEFFGQMVLGIIVFGVGLFLANLAASTIRASSNPQAGILATAARVAILVLSAAVALRQMGIANEIIELAFGLLLGSVAVATAIAFGLGGRDAASKQLEEWRGSLKN